MKKKSTVAALIVAAGSGRRMAKAIPKQFIEINGKPILRYTLQAFQTCTEIDYIYVILPADRISEYSVIFRKQWGISKLVATVAGGEQRHLSVWAGIEAVAQDVDIIMIHDGVRPFVTHRILRESIDAAEKYGAAVVGMRPKETVKTVDQKKLSQ